LPFLLVKQTAQSASTVLNTSLSVIVRFYPGKYKMTILWGKYYLNTYLVETMALLLHH